MKKSEAREGDESQRTRGIAMPHEKFNHGPPGERERIYQATSLIALVSDGISSQTRFRVFQQNQPQAAKCDRLGESRQFAEGGGIRRHRAAAVRPDDADPDHPVARRVDCWRATDLCAQSAATSGLR